MRDMYVIILINLEMATQYWKTAIVSTAMPAILEQIPTDSNFTT